MDRDKMSNLYKGPSIDSSYQLSVHLAVGFQRRRLKCEKLTAVALWAANIRKLAKDHKGYGSAATTSPVLVSFGPWKGHP
jgi:hypothetical protein